MMDLAKLGRDDVVYDLGSGDGRILIEAAKRGNRAVGFEIDPELVTLSEEKIESAGAVVKSKIIVHRADLFTADLSKADVVATYLPESFLTRLLPLFEKMKPGARIVSHQFQIPGWVANETLPGTSTEGGASHDLYLYVAPFSKGRR
jgi:16S rRNA A1518/A1519 N6-dimethyltransferase RsmA/KsgA/DIM1 with predicted DNA glycosylase/AP lyase activity